MKSFFFRVLIQLLICNRVALETPDLTVKMRGLVSCCLAHIRGWKTEFSRNGLFSWASEAIWSMLVHRIAEFRCGRGREGGFGGNAR